MSSDTETILAILTRVNQIWSLLQTVQGEEVKLMALADDLAAAVTTMVADVNKAIADLEQLLTAGGSVPDANVQAAITAIKTASTSLEAELAKVTNPPPPPPPSPGA